MNENSKMKDDLFGKSSYEKMYTCEMCNFSVKRAKAFYEHLLSNPHFKNFNSKYEDKIRNGESFERLKKIPRKFKLGVKINSCNPETILKKYHQFLVT